MEYSEKLLLISKKTLKNWDSVTKYLDLPEIIKTLIWNKFKEAVKGPQLIKSSFSERVSNLTLLSSLDLIFSKSKSTWLSNSLHFSQLFPSNSSLNPLQNPHPQFHFPIRSTTAKKLSTWLSIIPKKSSIFHLPLAISIHIQHVVAAQLIFLHLHPIRCKNFITSSHSRSLPVVARSWWFTCCKLL